VKKELSKLTISEIGSNKAQRTDAPTPLPCENIAIILDMVATLHALKKWRFAFCAGRFDQSHLALND
jgi:hypothetical protein